MTRVVLYLLLWCLVHTLSAAGKSLVQAQDQIGVSDNHDRTPSSRQDSVVATTRIAFGSCHKSYRATVPSIWEAMLANEESLDAFVWTGDAMYPSHRDPITNKKRYGPAPPSEIAKAFDEMKTNHSIGYTHLLSRKIPIYGTWDDHDYGGNDMGKHMPSRSERQQVFWSFLGYQPEGHDQPGMYHSIDLEQGRIKLILLDTRWFREDHCIPSVAHQLPAGNAIACTTRWATAGLNLWKYAKLWGKEGCDQAKILGNEQFEWLVRELASSTADLNVIVSSVQIFTSNPAMESWGHFPSEQQRLWQLLQKHYNNKNNNKSEGKSGPVVFLSGDVHHAEISGQEGYLEVTSSGLTHHCGQPKLYGRLCRPIITSFHQHRHAPTEFYIGLNYGVLSVDWSSRIATIQVKSPDGQVKLEVQQNLDATIDLPPYETLPHTWNGHLIPVMRTTLIAVVLAILFLARRLRPARAL